MKTSSSLTIWAASLFFAAAGSAAESIEVTHASGGSIRTTLSANIVLNSDSSLTREWVAIKHANLPVKLRGTPGVVTRYESGERYSTGSYEYSATVELDVVEPLVAIEICFLTFDVWGEHVRTLSLSEIKDFKVGLNKLTGSWHIYSENETSEFYASIAYIARARTKDGRVMVGDRVPVIAEAKKFYTKFSDSDLDPEKPKPAK
jgi:hypothetical protein